MILNHSFKIVKKFANFLDNIFKKEVRDERRRPERIIGLLATDYGRGYLDGVVGGLSMLLKISKKAEKYRKEEDE